MTDIELAGLRGLDPLGLFASLGALDVASRLLPDRRVTLRWTDDLQPSAVMSGPESLDHLVELCDRDRERWGDSPVLTWGPDSRPLADLKANPSDLRRWFEVVAEGARATGDRADLDLLCALVAEGATAGKTDVSKPTHFHFTAGQQRFLVMVRELQRSVDVGRFAEALAGPWRYDSQLPVLGWDVRGERIYALRGFNPAKSKAGDKKSGVPGADWLGFLGLRFFPVAASRGDLLTTGCSRSWKRSTFTWPLWDVPLTSATVASLVADRRIDDLDPPARRALGVHHLVRSPIRRTDQGGYGSFGAPEPVLARRRGAAGR